MHVSMSISTKKENKRSILCVLFAAFSEGMVDEGGYMDVVNIDISSVVIEAMQKKYQDRPQLKCILIIPSM